MTLVDSSVLIDLLEQTAQWYEWSAAQLFQASKNGALGVNAIVYAEISPSFADQAALDDFLNKTELQYLAIPQSAAFAANRAHRAYRKAGGKKLATLPDFFIGAHAASQSYPLLTRDTRRIARFFPGLVTISPR